MAIDPRDLPDVGDQLDHLDNIHRHLNAGNRIQAGVSTIATILSYVRRPVDVWRDREWRTLRGWGAGEFVEFPPPAPVQSLWHLAWRLCCLGDRNDGRENSIALVAHENGPRIPAAPTILLARKLLAGGIDNVGAFPCIGFLSLPDFAAFLAPYNIFVVRKKDGT